MTDRNLRGWFSEHWIELIIVGGIAFLAHTLFFDVRDRLAKTESLNETTKERLDRIADAIPSVTMKIASEYKYKPVEGVVLVGKPRFQDAAWVADAKIIDTELGVMTTLKFALENQNDQKSFLILKGAVSDLDENAVKVGYLNGLAKDGTLAAMMAAGMIQENSSFAYISNAEQLKKALVEAGATTTSTVQIPKGQVTWDELVGKIEMGQYPTLPLQQ